MSTDITPEGSVCPIFLVPDDPEQIAKDRAADAAIKTAIAAKSVARQAVLDKLGLTADEAKLLLS